MAYAIVLDMPTGRRGDIGSIKEVHETKEAAFEAWLEWRSHFKPHARETVRVIRMTDVTVYGEIGGYLEREEEGEI